MIVLAALVETTLAVRDKNVVQDVYTTQDSRGEFRGIKYAFPAPKLIKLERLKTGKRERNKAQPTYHSQESSANV